MKRYLGPVQLHFIKDFWAVRGEGTLGSFFYLFMSEVNAAARTHVAALGGNALLCHRFVFRLIFFDYFHSFIPSLLHLDWFLRKLVERFLVVKAIRCFPSLVMLSSWNSSRIVLKTKKKESLQVGRMEVTSLCKT